LSPFPAAEIWKAHTEPKCKFFAWLILHNKAPTANNLAKKNWPCNPICPLCFCQAKTTKHLLLKCNYIEALWDVICQKYELPPYPAMAMQGGPECWMEFLWRSAPVRTRRNKLGILFIFWWHVWKEINGRVFNNSELSVQQRASLIHQQMTLFNLAFDCHVLQNQDS
jgi:hypothetical protein